MLAFSKAVEAGCDGIELDVHLTADKQLVIMHDEDIRRTTDGTGLVKDYTFSELRDFDAGTAFQGKYGRCTVPSLEEYFDYIKNKPILTNIELKNSVIWYRGMEQRLIDLIRRYQLEDRMILSSFNHNSIMECKRIAPEIKCGFLCDCWIIDEGHYARTHGVECMHPSFTSLTDDIISEIHSQGIEINTWTVNDENTMRWLISRNVEAVISNSPLIFQSASGNKAGSGKTETELCL